MSVCCVHRVLLYSFVDCLFFSSRHQKLLYDDIFLIYYANAIKFKVDECILFRLNFELDVRILKYLYIIYNDFLKIKRAQTDEKLDMTLYYYNVYVIYYYKYQL